MKRKKTYQIMGVFIPAVMLFLCLTSFTLYYHSPPPDGPLNDDVPFSTAPACEECNYGFLPWGPLTCVDVPMYGGICSVKVCFRKRICNGRQQIKILSTMVPPQTPCEIENDDGDFTSANSSVLIKILSEHEPFGLVPPGTQFDWTNIDIYRYVCKTQILCPGQMAGDPPVEIIPPKLITVPCNKQACCKMSFTVRKLSADCDVEGYMGTQTNRDPLIRKKMNACDTSYNGYPRSHGENYDDSTRYEISKLAEKLENSGNAPCATFLKNTMAQDTATGKFKSNFQCTWDCKAMKMESGSGPVGGGTGTWKIVNGKFKYD